MSTVVSIPDADSIEVAWLNTCLQEHGYTGEVVDYTSAPVGSGQVGKCLRLNLSYRGAHTGPESLVAKFASDDPSSQATGVMLLNYWREVRFYQDMQHRLPIRTPQCLYAEIEGQGPRFCLLMEDLAPAQQGNQLDGCSAQYAQAAVQQLVGLHAPFWNDPSLREIDWIVGNADPSENATHALYQAQLAGFMDRYGPKLEADERMIIERIAHAVNSPFMPPQGDEPFSLVHVDYRLDNMMFLETEGKVQVTVVDWQSITIGAPLNDVAYFLGAGLLPQDRGAAEAEIVRNYHEGLLQQEVEVAWDACWQGYRRGSFAGIAMAVIASMIVEQTERGDAMFTVMATRHARHAIDLGAAEFLD